MTDYEYDDSPLKTEHRASPYLGYSSHQPYNRNGFIQIFIDLTMRLNIMQLTAWKKVSSIFAGNKENTINY